MAGQPIRKSDGETAEVREDQISQRRLSTFEGSKPRTKSKLTPDQITSRADRASSLEETDDSDHPSPESRITRRLNGLESQNRRLRFLLLMAYLLFGYVLYLQFTPNQVVVEEKRSQTKEILLVDNAGVARMHLRMYSDRPLLQLLDANGTARLSLGMRFDDAPFIDFTDRDGTTRATFNMSELDEPAIRLYDEDGKPSFALN